MQSVSVPAAEWYERVSPRNSRCGSNACEAETYCWHNRGRRLTFGLARGHKRPVSTALSSEESSLAILSMIATERTCGTFPFITGLCRRWEMVNSLMLLAFEANGVIALRIMKLMRGGKIVRREAELRVGQKMHAAFEASASLMAGASGNEIVLSIDGMSRRMRSDWAGSIRVGVENVRSGGSLSRRN